MNTNQFDSVELINVLRKLRKDHPDEFSILYRELIGSFLTVCSPIDKLDIAHQIDKSNSFVDTTTQIRFHYENRSEYERVTKFRKAEPETKKWINEFANRDIFFDIGANIGFFSLYAAQRIEGIRVYSFEPHHSNYNSLFKNIVLNKLTGIITPLNCGVSDSNKIETFSIHSLLSGTAKSVVGSALDTFGNKFNPVLSINVQVLSIDKAISYFNIPIPTHIKIDVDGIELSVLHGAAATLRNNSLKSLMVESSSQSQEDLIAELLYPYNFHIYMKQDKLYDGGHTRNIYFKRN